MAMSRLTALLKLEREAVTLCHRKAAWESVYKGPSVTNFADSFALIRPSPNNPVRGMSMAGVPIQGAGPVLMPIRVVTMPAVAAQRSMSSFLIAAAIRSGNLSGEQAKLGTPNWPSFAASV